MLLIITSNFSLQFQSSTRWVAHVTRGFLAHYSWSYYSSMATERSLLERISTVGGFTVFSVIYSELIGEGVRHFFLTYIFTSYPIFTKYSRHEIPARKNFGSSKYLRENIWTHEIPAKSFWTYDISMRKNLEPTKYPREEILDPQNAH